MKIRRRPLYLAIDETGRLARSWGLSTRRQECFEAMATVEMLGG